MYKNLHFKTKNYTIKAKFVKYQSNIQCNFYTTIDFDNDLNQ